MQAGGVSKEEVAAWLVLVSLVKLAKLGSALMHGYAFHASAPAVKCVHGLHLSTAHHQGLWLRGLCSSSK